jgi:hypothetical protein
LPIFFLCSYFLFFPLFFFLFSPFLVSYYHFMPSCLFGQLKKFESHHWKVNKINLVIAIRFHRCRQMEIEKGDKKKPPSTCFGHLQQWVT